MPRPYNAPCIIDYQLTLKVGLLSKNGFFKPSVKELKGRISYKLNRGILDLTIHSFMDKYNEYLILSYIDFKGDEVRQKIILDSLPSNLGKGLVWSFICPITFEKCRNLIFVNSRFMHRSNLVGALYQKQFEGKYWREYFKLQPNIPTTKRILDEPNQKYYKKYYKGKPTKRYKKWNDTINKWNANQDKKMRMFDSRVTVVIDVP